MRHNLKGRCGESSVHGARRLN